jgi:hypothetical protein
MRLFFLSATRIAENNAIRSTTCVRQNNSAVVDLYAKKMPSNLAAGHYYDDVIADI